MKADDPAPGKLRIFEKRHLIFLVIFWLFFSAVLPLILLIDPDNDPVNNPGLPLLVLYIVLPVVTIKIKLTLSSCDINIITDPDRSILIV